MKAVLPVAGVGSRLRPQTLGMPKALVPVAGKPILGHILDDLVLLGVTEVVLIISPAGGPIVDYVKQSYPFLVESVIQQEALGIGHALYQSRMFVQQDEPWLIILGDTVYHTDFSLLTMGLATSAIGVKALDGDLTRYGLAVVEGDQVIRLVEKPDNPPSDLVLAGVYYIKKPSELISCLEELIREKRTTRGEFQLTDGLQLMIDRGVPLRIFPVDEWHDCGTPEQLLATNRRLLGLKAQPVLIAGSVVIPPVVIAADARIEASVIGPYVSVSAGVQITRSVIADTIVGERVVIRDSLLDASIIGSDSVLVGRSRQINAGARTELRG